MNDLLYRLIEEESRYGLHEWTISDLERLDKDEIAALIRAGFMVPSPARKGRYILDVNPVARLLRSSRSLQGSPPTQLHWWGFIYLGYFVERARVVACVWALQPNSAYDDEHPREYHMFWSSVPDRPDNILFVWPEWESWKAFTDAYHDLKHANEGRHEPLGEWLARIRMDESAPGAAPLPHPAEPPSSAPVVEPLAPVVQTPRVATPGEVVFTEVDGHYEVAFEGKSGRFSASQVVLLMRLAEGLVNAIDDAGFVRRDEFMDLVQSQKEPLAAFRSLIRRTKDGLKKSGIQLSIRYHTSGGYKLKGNRKGMRLTARADIDVTNAPLIVAEAVKDLNASYDV